ncbi:MAG: hypothetical protein ACOCP8_01870 [archaeon]
MENVKPKIEYYINTGYYITYDYDFRTDEEVAGKLNINLNTYHKLGINNNGFIDIDESDEQELYFKNREDAENFIEDLTPYLIANKLASVGE